MVCGAEANFVASSHGEKAVVRRDFKAFLPTWPRS